MCSNVGVAGVMYSPTRQEYAAVYLPQGTSSVSANWDYHTLPGFNAGVAMYVSVEAFDAAVGSGPRVVDVNNWSGDASGTTTTSVTVPAAGWYRLSINTHLYWYVSGDPGPGTWSVLVSTSGQQPCAPGALELYCSCSEAGHATNAGSARDGDPVGTAVGNVMEDATDLAVPTRGGQLEVRRSYNSLVAGNDSTIGYGWANNWSTHLQFDAPASGDVSVWQPSGVPVVFSPMMNSDGSVGGYTAGSWINATLTKAGSDVVFQLKDGLKYTYGSDGKLRTITNLQGYVTNFTYTSGNLSSVTDADSGRSLAVTWTGGRIHTITDGASRSVTYAYDGSGNLSDATDGGGAHWKFGYDASHQLTSVRHPNQVAANVTNQDVVNTYTSGKVTLQTDNRVSPALVRQFDYTTIPGATKIIDPKGNVRVDYYTEGRRTKVVDGYGTPEAVTRTFTYDPSTGAVATVAVGEGAGAVTVATNRYDSSGDLISSADALSRTTKATYNEHGQPLTVTDPAGIVTTFDYGSDGLGTLKSQCAPLGPFPAAGATLTCGDSGTTPSRTTWTYGDTNHPGDVTMVKSPTQQDSDVGDSTRFSYDVDGQVKTVTEAATAAFPTGTTTTYCYDNVGRLTSTYSPRAGTVACGDASAFKTSFAVDGYGAATGITAPSTNPVTRSFDAEHNVTSEQGADGHTTAYVRDGAGRPTQTRQADDTASPSVSLTRWNPDGTVQETEDPAGNITHYDYDHVGRVIAQIDPSGTRNHTYDAFSRVATSQDPGGNCAATPKTGCTTFGYDAASRLTSIDYSDPLTQDITVGYDLDGRVTSRGGGSTATSQVWDSLGRLASSTVGSATTQYGYDLAGRTTSITYPGSTVPVVRSYDAAGRWIASIDGTGSTATTGNTTSFGYDADSNWTSTTFPSAVNTDTYTVDNAGRPTAITYTQGATTLGSLTYGRDGAGRVTSETVATLTAASSTYGYNALGQLDRVNSTSPNLAYDTAKNLTSQPGQVQQFNAANQICWSATSGSGSCTAPPTGATRYGFDNRGNRTSTDPATGATNAATFDQANRLTSVAVEDLSGDQYTSLSAAVKVLDTGSSPTVGKCPTSNTQCLPLNATNGNTREVQIAGEAGLPAAGQIGAVVVNIVATGTCTSCAGVVSLWPNDVTFPWTTNVNYTGTEAVSNTAIVRLPADGRLKVYATDANVQLWVSGYFAPNNGTWDNAFEAVNPANIAGTSSTPSSQSGVCSPDCGRFAGTGTAPDTKTFEVRGHGGIPATGVTAVAINVGIVNPAGDGNLLVGPSNNWPSQTIPYHNAELGSNLLIVPVGADGRIGVWAWGGAVDVRLDVYGYFTGDPSATGGYHPLTTQTTIMRGETGATAIGKCPDTTHPCSPLGAAQTITVQVGGEGGIPTTNVDSVVVNLSATSTNPGWIGVWADDGSPYPGNVTLYEPGGGSTNTVATTATVKVGPTGRIKIFTWAATDLRIDTYGYFTPAATTTTYAYDNDGLRTTKTTPDGTTTTYTWDTTNPLIPLLLTETTGTNTTRYIYGPGGTPYEQINPDGTLTYLHRDQLGSTRLLTNASGTNIGERAYTPYGKPSTTTGTAATPFGYAGQYTDTDTGYQYLRARYYDPQTGQFLGQDPLASITQDPYGYARRSPLQFRDPSGLDCADASRSGDWANGDCTEPYSEYPLALSGPSAIPESPNCEYQRQPNLQNGVPLAQSEVPNTGLDPLWGIALTYCGGPCFTLTLAPGGIYLTTGAVGARGVSVTFLGAVDECASEGQGLEISANTPWMIGGTLSTTGSGISLGSPGVSGGPTTTRRLSGTGPQC